METTLLRSCLALPKVASTEGAAVDQMVAFTLQSEKPLEEMACGFSRRDPETLAHEATCAGKCVSSCDTQPPEDLNGKGNE